MHLLGQLRCLLCYRYALEVYARTTLRRATYLPEVRGQTIREVNHRRGTYTLVAQRLENVGFGAWLKVSLQEVAVAVELRLGVIYPLKHTLLALE